MTGLILTMPGGNEIRIEDADELIERYRAAGVELVGTGAYLRVQE